MNIRFSKHTRQYHKWVGLVCSVFFVILSVTGVILMHYEELGLNNVNVSGKFLPQKYFQVVSKRRSIQALAVMENASGVSIFAGTSHGLFRSQNGGSNWTELKEGLFNQRIHSLAVLPGDGIVYAGTAQGIFRSEDGGDSWTDWFDETSGLPSGEVADIAVHSENPDTLFAATRAGLYSSADGGESWEPSFLGADLGETPPVTFVRFSAVDSRLIFIGTERDTYRSVNGGADWEKVWEEPIGAPIRALLALKTDPEFLYAGTGQGLYKSFNQGRNWIRDKNKNIKSVRRLFSDPGNLSHLYLVTDDRLFFSPDGGDHWRRVEIERGGIEGGEGLGGNFELTRVTLTHGPSPVLLAGTRNGLLLSRDSGKSWAVADLAHPDNQAPREELRMDLVKLITEIHTGRFFGSWFVWLVDIATLGLIFLIFTGVVITVYRSFAGKKKAVSLPEEIAIDEIIDFKETAHDLSTESHQIHDMIEHISKHLEKCKTVYMSREKGEIKEVTKHITTLDKKMQRLMERLEEFEKIS